MNWTANNIHNDLSLAMVKSSGGDIHSIEEVHVFPQVFSSTALCFGGIGGQAITTANVICIWLRSNKGYIYVGGREFKSELDRGEFSTITKNRRIEY